MNNRYPFSVGGEFLDKNNTGSNSFTIDLNDQIDFSSGYQVALHNITVNSASWNQVRPQENLLILRNSSYFWVHRRYVAEGFYASKKAFVDALNKAMEVKMDKQDTMRQEIRLFRPFEEERLYFTKQEPVNNSEFYRKAEIINYPKFNFEGWIDFGGYFEYREADGKLQFKSSSRSGVTAVLLSKQLACLAGVGPHSTRYTWIERDDVLPNPVNLYTNNLSLLWVYADFIEHTYVNDTMQPLLKLVAIDDSTNQIINKVIANHIYVPVKRRKFQQLNLTFKANPTDTPPLILHNTVRFILHFTPI